MQLVTMTACHAVYAGSSPVGVAIWHTIVNNIRHMTYIGRLILVVRTWEG